MRLFRILLCLVTLAGAVAYAPTTALAHDEGSIVFTGHGWGHGVGMSQYGARAMAADDPNTGAADIVEYYFTDTDVVPLADATSGWLVDDPEPLWVNLTGTPYGSAQQVSFATVGGKLTFCQEEPASVGSMYEAKNKDAYSPYVKLLEKRLQNLGYSPGAADGWFDSDTTNAVEAFQTDKGLVVDGIVGPNTKNALWPPDSGDRCVIKTTLTGTAATLTPNADGSECTLDGALAPGACVGSVRNLTPEKRLVIPGRKISNGSSIELGHGDVRVRPDRDGGNGAFEGLHVLVEIGVDDYVYGISEIPLWWWNDAEEAVKAQTIASRSYAVGTARSIGAESGFTGSRKDYCWCHLWSNTYSQVYAGYFMESVSSGVWKSAADSTAGMVLRHPSAGLVTAFFSSSSGGASEANEDAWGGTPLPYLRSVADAWSLDPSNPFADWSYSFTPQTTAAKMGMDDLIGVDVVEKNESGSARTVRFTGVVNGSEVTVDKSGGWVRSVFGLRSNYFDVGWGETSEPPQPPPNDGVFTDIAGNTFENDIQWAYDTGVTKGCNPPDNTRFCPDQPVTRGQMAAFLNRFLNLPKTSKDFFTDDDGSTFEGDINRLAAAGITKGCGSSRFCPDDKVTRAQMAAFLTRALDLTENTHPGFADVSESNTFYNDIGRLATAGVTKGCNPPSNTKYCPSESVTRAQMTAFLHRASKTE